MQPHFPEGNPADILLRCTSANFFTPIAELAVELWATGTWSAFYSILAHPVVSVFCQLSPKQQKYQNFPYKKGRAEVAALTTRIEEMLYVFIVVAFYSISPASQY